MYLVQNLLVLCDPNHVLNPFSEIRLLHNAYYKEDIIIL